MRSGARSWLVAAIALAVLFGASRSAPASVPRYATPAGYGLTFRGAVQGTASGGAVRGCAFDPLGLPEFAVQWTGFTVNGVPYDLSLDARGRFRTGAPIPVTNDPHANPAATLRIRSGKRVFDRPRRGSV